MYAWIFRKLPGPFWVRSLLALVLIAGVVLLLMNYVFPWFSEYSFLSPLTDSTIGGS
ncbi:hypothetical protein J2M53_05390 [Arthrobacter sp. zg-ZUI100]|uniref:Uncharacterized protein n=1 Tax=Arthrobacter jiangjiafuii TaxID=2817475 RepID=A0A975M528_9MICC|nr:hypothetical protein [Arthrobacter jiangjiafuii]MBP3035691.1 hypothetical protein [Arthrobacter jiangjiafuii]MBP3042114.1 hypothetical protein [Arthrobacter jiangjiafuii]QWC10111.1 hypothetical protein KKR91_00090 [Arthrobacter jiangjiafuii]